MRLLALAPAVFPSEEIARKKLWLFLLSCKRFEIQPALYGMGTKVFPGYAGMKIDCQLDYLTGIGNGCTHVLYTDSWDVLFTGPLEEIEAKYIGLGQPPILVSAFYQLGNISNELERYPGCFDHSIVYRYPNCGGYIGELPLMIKMFSRMKATYPHYGDDSWMWYDAWKEGWFRPVLDSNCEIFQVRSEENTRIVEDVEGVAKGIPRIRNESTGSHPCVFHLSGGYASQETGKDDAVMPWAKKLRLVL